MYNYKERGQCELGDNNEDETLGKGRKWVETN